MPWDFLIDPNTGLAVVTCTGTLGLEEAREGVRALWQHPDWPGVAAVWDFRSARLDFSTADVREAAQFVLAHQPATPPRRVAFVTAHDADFGLVRMFEVFREHPGTEVRAFRQLEAATHWALGEEPAP
jgi:acetaldehyde dehydrogenase (acetylating)